VCLLCGLSTAHQRPPRPVQVDMLYGRKIQAVPEQVRWLESFTVSDRAAVGGPCCKLSCRGVQAACWQQGAAHLQSQLPLMPLFAFVRRSLVSLWVCGCLVRARALGTTSSCTPLPAARMSHGGTQHTLGGPSLR
jgi:hypothetical protein